MFETICGTIQADTSLPARVARLDILRRVLDGTLYDNLPYQFHEERNSAGEYIPLRLRRPSVRYGLCRVVVEDSVALLFSAGHFPAIEADDPALVRCLQDVTAESRLNEVMIDAAIRGSVGSVAVLFRVLQGRVFFSVLESLYAASFGPVMARKYDMGTQVATAVQQGAANFRCVRVTDGTDTAASLSVLGAITFTAMYTGSLGNQLRLTFSPGSAASSWRLTIAMPGLSPEIYDNITGTGLAFWNNLASAVNNGNGALHGPSQLVVATTLGGTAVPVAGVFLFASGNPGLDGATGVNAAMLVGTATEWSLLTQLAQAEGFALWVSGEVLNFGPWPEAAPVLVTPANVSALAFDMINALPAAVTVKSWNTRNKAVVSQSQGSGAGMTLVRPNLTAAQARALAAAQLTVLGQHEVVMSATMPGDVVLRPGMTLVMAGTGSALDQSYIVAAVARRLSAVRGFEQSVTAYAVN